MTIECFHGSHVGGLMQKPNLSLKKAAGLQQVLETSNIRVTTVTGREIEALIKNTVISHLSLHTQQNVLDHFI